jgi:hypothetical protein
MSGERCRTVVYHPSVALATRPIWGPAAPSFCSSRRRQETGRSRFGNVCQIAAVAQLRSHMV